MVRTEFVAAIKQVGTLGALETVETVRKVRGLLARQVAQSVAAVPAPAGVKIESRMVPSRHTPGHSVPVRTYTAVSSTVRTPMPCCIYIHGGGFMFGTMDDVHFQCTRFASDLQCTVINVDYRLAPEFPFPVPLEDCYDAVLWTFAHAKELNIDVDKVAIGGVSAGGCLAAGVTQLLRDRRGPPLCFQLLVYPTVDTELSPSVRQFHDSLVINADFVKRMWKHYLGENNVARPPKHAAPLKTDDLSRLPPAYIEVCELDPLRDEGIAYAQQLLRVNVSTELILRRGCPHGFELFGSKSLNEQAFAERSRALQQAFSDPPFLSRL